MWTIPLTSAFVSPIQPITMTKCWFKHITQGETVPSYLLVIKLWLWFSSTLRAVLQSNALWSKVNDTSDPIRACGLAALRLWLSPAVSRSMGWLGNAADICDCTERLSGQSTKPCTAIILPQNAHRLLMPNHFVLLLYIWDLDKNLGRICSLL